MGRLEGRTAIITGASRGIGLATLERFRAEGARVLAINRPRDAAPAPSDSVIYADVTDHAALQAAIHEAHQRLGHLDICLANAGTMLLEDLLDGAPERWEPLLRVNLIGVMSAFQAAAAHMIAAGRGGRLLATASVAGLRGEAGSPAYCASKAGVLALIQSLALELARHHVTVNAVAPGEIDTDMHASVVDQLAAREHRHPDDIRRAITQARIPAGRMGVADDVARLFAFLASHDAAYISGETIRVDGGELLV